MSSSENSEKDLQKAIQDATKTCTTNQTMIGFTSTHLVELRSCASTDKIIQTEIKEAEVGSKVE